MILTSLSIHELFSKINSLNTYYAHMKNNIPSIKHPYIYLYLIVNPNHCMGPKTRTPPVHIALSVFFLFFFITCKNLISLYSNFKPTVGRVSRTGIPDRSCLSTISHKFFINILAKLTT